MARSIRLGNTAKLMTAGLVGVGMLAACDQGSEASRAIDDAGRSIHAIAGGGGAAMEPSITVDHFARAQKALERPSLDGTDVEKAGVMVLKARTAAGLAAGDSLLMGQLERQAAEQAAEIRSLIRRWEEQNALAAAAESYDPSAELAELAKVETDIKAQIQRAEQAKREIDGRIAELESQIVQLQQAASAERAKSAELELKAAAMTAIAAAEIAPQIQQHAQAAEGKLFDVSRLQARADHMRTGATEASLTLGKLAQQLAINEQAKADVAAMQQAGRNEAETARAKAREAAQQVRAKAEALLAFRDGRAGVEGAGLEQISADQVSKLRNAVSNARQAVSGMRVGARAALGSANIALGDALSKRARSFEDVAMLMERAAQSTPALPESAWFADQAAKARTQATAALAEAREAYVAAAEDLASLGGKAETADLLNKLSDRLRKSAGGGPASEDEPTGGDASADEDQG
ncbi:MAG: hypothetical protein KJZ65_09890 [Phycisphaerales bacterium]|nr:hypothetical protein [Phycisphaerales bacterium]